MLPSATCRMVCPHILLDDLVRARILLRSHSCLLIVDQSVHRPSVELMMRIPLNSLYISQFYPILLFIISSGLVHRRTLKVMMTTYLLSGFLDACMHAINNKLNECNKS